MANGPQVAAEAQAQGCLLFANTVTPGEWRQAVAEFSPYPNVAVGFGLHPWWVEPSFDADALMESLDCDNPLILGEIGLDLGRRHSETIDQQILAFQTFARWAGARGGRLLSLHAVHGCDQVLRELDRSGALESCACIFHWFTGPSDVLKRAIQGGCYFSCGPRMLRTGKGREYVKAIPADRLLLETDWPPEQGATCCFSDLRQQLEIVAEAIAAIKGRDVLPLIAQTSQSLIGPLSPFRR